MLSPSLEKAPLPPSFLTSAQAAANNNTNNNTNNPAHAASSSSSSRCYRPFEHLLQQPMLDGGVHHLQQQQLQQLQQQQKLSWNSIGFGVSSFGLPSPPSSESSIGSGFGRLLLSADTHRASSNCSSASSTRSDCSGGGSPEPLRNSPPAHASSMPRARSGFGLSNGNITPTAMNSISSNDARLLHPLAMHYAAAAQLQQHVSNGRHPLHPLNGATGLGSVNSFGEANTSAATLPLLFANAGTLQPARMTTTGPRLDDDGCSDDELNVDSNGDDAMNSEMALNLTGRARSCSPASIASNSGSRPPSAGHSDRHPNGCPLPASFSLLTSSTILGQSSLLSSSVFPPPPSSPTPPSASTTPEMKMNSLNGTSGVGPTSHSKPTCASLQRAHSAPYKPHKWLRPVNGNTTTANIICPSQNDSAPISSPLSLGSLSPLSSLAPLSPLPTPPTPPHSHSTSTSSGNNHNGSTICSPLLHQHQQHLMSTLSGPTSSLPAPPPPPQLELRLTRQPAKFHRARYMTEGSRGPIRDKSGKSFPAIRLIGFDEHPVPVYCYLSDDRQIAQPHLFYQASKLSSRCVTSCTELRLGGTNALQFELQPSQNMELTIDCLGIVKQRLFEIQQNAAAAGGNGSSASVAATAAAGMNGSSTAPLDRGAKSPCCRIVFECYLPKYNHILQTYSDTIHCKQVMRAPEVHRMSSNEAPARGGGELFVIGKNFGKDARLLLRLDGGQWQAHAWPEKELLHQTHLVCRLPSFDASLMRSRGECVAGQWRVQVELYVLCDGKRSAKQLFTYYE